MEKYELSKDWVKKNGAKIKRAHNLVITDGYDIKSTQDVLKILRIVDPANASEENAKVLSKILQLFASRMKKAFEIKPKAKSRIIN